MVSIAGAPDEPQCSRLDQPAALLAFWLPARGNLPHFDPLLLLTSAAGLAFCLMTPVYLALLILYYPGVNSLVLRLTSFAGVVIGCYQMLFTFGLAFHDAWWVGVLHLPLLLLSLYGLVLGYRRRPDGARS